MNGQMPICLCLRWRVYLVGPPALPDAPISSGRSPECPVRPCPALYQAQIKQACLGLGCDVRFLPRTINFCEGGKIGRGQNDCHLKGYFKETGLTVQIRILPTRNSRAVSISLARLVGRARNARTGLGVDRA